MEKRVLGRTGLEVSAVGMGGLFVSRHGGESHEEVRRAVWRALELSVNYVDTAVLAVWAIRSCFIGELRHASIVMV